MTADKDTLNKKFWHFVIPSVFSYALSGIYCFVDAYFVGNMVGDSGLAAINISFVFISFLAAIGSGIGAGASVKYSINIAQNRKKEATDYIGCAIAVGIILSIIVCVPMLTIPKEILIALGASEKVSESGKVYLFINGLGSIVQVLGNITIPLLRNCGLSFYAMVAVVTGCVSNIFLDWLFIWVLDWGLKGAAIATVLGEAFAFLVCFVLMLKTKNIKIGCQKFMQRAKDIALIGISPFGLCLVPNISVTILNKASLFYGGDTAIAAYGCMAYLVFIVYLIMQGIGDGVQPLISLYYGQSNTQMVKKLRNKAFNVTMIMAFLSFIPNFLFPTQLGLFMGASEQSILIIKKGLPIMALGFYAVGLSRCIASCLYAEEKNLKSYFISFSEPVFIILSLIVLPKSLKLDSVWWANTIAQFIVAVFAVIFIKKV